MWLDGSEGKLNHYLSLISDKDEPITHRPLTPRLVLPGLLNFGLSKRLAFGKYDIKCKLKARCLLT